MKLLAKIMSSRKFEYNGNKYCKIQGFFNELGLFEQTVKEELVPDSLEGKQCEIEFDIGVAKFRPYLKVLSIHIC